jgi:hypothetical protein
MKTTLFLTNAAVCLSIGVSLASEPFSDDVNKNHIIPKLDSQALSNYASTNKTNSIAIKAYKSENGIDDKIVLIHCPSSTEMKNIVNKDPKGSYGIKYLRTAMGWSFDPSSPETLIDKLSGSKLTKIYICKKVLICEYTKQGQESPVLCERLLKPSQKSLILNSWSPVNPNIRVEGDIILIPKPLKSTIFIGTTVPTFRLENPSEHTPQTSSKLLPEDVKEGVDLVFNQSQCPESLKPSVPDLFQEDE